VYDNAGNRLSRTTNGSVDSWTYDDRNRVLTGPEFTYVWRPGGELDCSTVNGVVHDTYYDSFGHMSGTKVGNGPWTYYFFDGFDRIWRRQVNSSPLVRQYWLYDGLNQDPFRTTGEAGVITYGRSPNGQLTSTNDQRNGTSKPRIAGANQHGDLAWLAPANGNNSTKSVSYGPFGTEYVKWGGDPNPEYTYQTQYTDPNTGDINMQSRWYSPTSATFRSRDTFGGYLQTPVSLNRYTYAGNNPIRYSDRTGFDYNVACGCYEFYGGDSTQADTQRFFDDGTVSHTTNSADSVVSWISDTSGQAGTLVVSSSTDSGNSFNVTHSSQELITAGAYQVVSNSVDGVELNGIDWDQVGHLVNVYQDERQPQSLSSDSWYIAEQALALGLIAEGLGAGLIGVDANSASGGLAWNGCTRYCNAAFSPLSTDLIGLNQDRLGDSLAAQGGDIGGYGPAGMAMMAGGGSLIDGLTGLRNAPRLGPFSRVPSNVNAQLPANAPRIPENARIREFHPSQIGGAQHGVEFVFDNADGVTTRIRIHGPDGTAPPGSNAATGDVLRIQVGGRYMDASGNLHHRGVTNPRSPYYDEVLANELHIPWQR